MIKRIVLLLLALIEIAAAQTIPFTYSIKLNPITISNLPGLHSFVAAQWNGYWLILGGRTDGLHARQPFNSFPAASNNTDIYVIDVLNTVYWTAPLSQLPPGLQEQLQSSNMNFYQDDDTLYVAGGYGYSNSAGDHITYPHLTSVNVSGLINAVINGDPITSFFKQITDQNFAVTGAQLGKIGNYYYLVGGHRFDGRYNPMGNPTYTQTYVSGYKKFKLNNSGSQLSYSDYTTITDQIHLHRRDYNLVPQIFPNGEYGYTISSGVFQTGVNLPFLYPVDITASGYTPQPSFNQYLSNYHSAKAALYDSTNNTMHSLFFGGMSQYTYSGNTLIQDNNVPFVKTISRVSRDASGNLEENIFTEQMPSLIGASAEFILNHAVPHSHSEVIKLSDIHSDSTLIGHIYGGIYSPLTNPFANNNTTVTSANNVVYEVWLIKDNSTGFIPLNGENPFHAKLFPNPAEAYLSAVLETPYEGNLNLWITNAAGIIVYSETFPNVRKGSSKLKLPDNLKLANGIYSFNFTFDGKYSRVEKMIIPTN